MDYDSRLDGSLRLRAYRAPEVATPVSILTDLTTRQTSVTLDYLITSYYVSVQFSFIYLHNLREAFK